MAITTLDQLIAAPKQRIRFVKTATRTATSFNWTSVFDLAGAPGAGTLAGANTANGVVPTALTAGYPAINAFGGGASGYLASMSHFSSVLSRIALFDRLFLAGAYAFNASVALTAQPSYAARVPGGTDFTACELWIEAVTAFTGIPTITITYTNQSGVAGRTTGAVSLGSAPIVGRMFQMPLAAGDSGIQKIESVTCTVATAGTFNVCVLRRLWTGRVAVANGGENTDFLKLGMPQLFADSALYMLINPDSTATGLPDLFFDIANG